MLPAQTMPRIVVSSSDHAVLEKLLESHAGARDESLVESLGLELARAEVVPDGRLPAGVVALGSTVRFRDLDSGEVREVRLVLPRQADPQRGAISVLAPMGCAILGLSAGQSIAWPVPGGRRRRIEIVAVAPPPAETA